ncbi:helicase [Lysobacter arseniciresistens ZS79]|uniref:Helicase n=1 Tax=Lysobacter arseniciresistens ZS79 TaxID=913325 RepID=A0A0A0F4R3_9GAMM|nr:DUF3427 domain-containing protein [Lysobacter arseniciresistens]KGM57829.1 helicase [Lysobacter arseniciresistens ZS79]
MTDLHRGLYEQLVTEALETQLKELDTKHRALRGRIHGEEAADRIALHLGTLVRRVISGLDTKQRTEVGLDLARQIIRLLDASSREVDLSDAPSPAGDMLHAVARLLPDGTPEHVGLPATPLLDTTLLTNAPGEPRIGFQLQSEVPSADRIDILMAFVRMSGIQPLLDLLQRHKDASRPLRLLTTTYTNSTELSALRALRDLGADIRVSYDTSSTRLHAKAWLFHRASGYSTAYIGSSNLTHSAQVTGLEWNVRISGARNPDVIDKFSAVFDSYWNNEDFRPFDESEYRELTRAPVGSPRIYPSPLEIRPEPFQSRLLEQIELARLQGRHRNLLVSATGTGKTVMAALDYQRLRSRLPRARLLFIAHRKEILEQSLATFRHALRDAAFGELWVGGDRPTLFEHVFASVQSLTAAGITNIDPDHFDVVIIDEFHHAAARTYKALLDHLCPVELLALTATPERGDEEPILQWFDGRIAAELRLWDAIDQHRLSPFAYYGISDGVDYRGVSWRRGRGYDPQELSALVTGDHALARLIVANVAKVVPNAVSMRALAFCVSVAHARFMADQFNAAGLPSIAVWAETPEQSRRGALSSLAAGDLRVVFSVDLFNEGVDVPSVDTLLLLRPTDSPTVFLQQLGRGLRREPGKSVCTVLDFVGQHRKEFQFYRRFGALLGGTRKQLEKQIESGFPFLPSGCHMQLDAVATETVLQNIRQSLPSTWPAKARELQRVAETTSEITLKRFLDESGLSLEDVYSNNHCWSDLLEAGGLPTLPVGPEERALRRALGRLLHLDDEARIKQYRAFAQAVQPPDIRTEDLRTRRLFHMLATVLTESVRAVDESLDDAASLIWKHPQVLQELNELMQVLAQRIDHVQTPLSTHPEVPLYVHARYTRREILAAFGDGENLKVPEWREGVRWLPDAQVDLLAFTLDKASGHFSPTTRYRDYAISRELIHWESQSGTRADSDTGLRYQQHEVNGSSVLPFARLITEDRAFWLLGPASYVNHEGDRPMGITWRLLHELPGDLYARFAAAVS